MSGVVVHLVHYGEGFVLHPTFAPTELEKGTQEPADREDDAVQGGIPNHKHQVWASHLPAKDIASATPSLDGIKSLLLSCKCYDNEDDWRHGKPQKLPKPSGNATAYPH